MRIAQLLTAIVTCAALAGNCKDGGGEDSNPDRTVAPLARGDRYGEILLIRADGNTLLAEVWGTQGLNTCPAASWRALDAEAIRAETGAIAVNLNGPRVWLPNRTTGSRASPKTRKFGDLEMRRLATVEIEVPSQAATVPRPPRDNPTYTERTVRRDTTFVFNEGEEIYELTSPTGAVYVMQSMSQIVDAELQLNDLKDLASRLKLPTGWTYRVSSLDAACVLIAKGKAVVLQDDLRNTYQRR